MFFAVCTMRVLLTSEDVLCCSVEPQEIYFGMFYDLLFFLSVPPGALLFLFPASVKRLRTLVCCGNHGALMDCLVFVS